MRGRHKSPHPWRVRAKTGLLYALAHLANLVLWAVILGVPVFLGWAVWRLVSAYL